MRFYKGLTVFLLLAMVLSPLAALNRAKKTQPQNEASETTVEPQITDKTADDETVKVLLTKSSEVVAITMREYLVGVLAAEMSPTFHEEALKAQAVAAHTYLVRKRAEQEKTPDASLNGAYLSDNSAKHQGYLTPEQRKEKWGDKAENYEKKLTAAVDGVLNKLITYDGQPIIAAFHAISCGKTLSAKAVWGGEIAYLQSVVSAGDKLSPDCVKTTAFKADEFSALVSGLEGCSLSGESSEWVGEIKADASGLVTSIEIGGKKFTGVQVREALGLRSSVFTVEYKDSSFLFTTTGYGHCVGLSQYGADYMARQGSTWSEIIEHYYSGVTIAEA